MRRILLVQPSLQPPGGGNGVAAWVLYALTQEHRVTVLSWEPVDVDPINRFFGTALRASDFDRIGVPRAWRMAIDHLPTPSALIRTGLLMRYTRRFSAAFDVIVGVHNEADYGRRGIQYVHYPTYFRPRPEVDLRWYHRWPPVLNVYYRVADWIADYSPERMKANLTLANSDWTAERIQRFLGVRARTLYPPVVDGAPPLAWAERKPGFLAIGRISPEKEYERVIRILTRVQTQVPDLSLTIVGTWDRHTRRYLDRLREMAAAAGSWVHFRRDLSREDVQRLMASHRYGLHGMREEHFGMAPAEMMRAGMIVWVPNGGGQVEIVGDEPILRYQSEEEAAQKILTVIGNAAEQQRLRAHLAARAPLFGADRFVQQVQEIVRDFRQ